MSIGGNLDFNFCALGNGGYNDCVKEKESVKSPPSGSTTNYDTSDDGLAGWAIALIVILVLSIVFCGGYAIAVIFFGVTNCFKGRNNSSDSKAKFHNNSYLDGDGSKYTNRDARSEISGYNSRQLMLLPGQPSHSQAPGDDAFTINTYSTSKRKVSRDPTMFIPGQEGKPDPKPNVLAITDGLGCSHRYYEEGDGSSHRYSTTSTQKPKRDPTMYVNGVSFADKPKSRDPTMYIEGTSSYRYEDEDDEQYQMDDFNGNEAYNRSEQLVTRKQSVFMEEVSIQAGEQSLASRSARSKKSRNSGKKSSYSKEEKPVRRMDTEDSRCYPSYPDLNYVGPGEAGMNRRPTTQSNVAASLFNLNTSTPNLNGGGLDVGSEGHKRGTQSFYE